jgi:hypothetical protein
MWQLDNKALNYLSLPVPTLITDCPYTVPQLAYRQAVGEWQAFSRRQL